jgi:HPt (histidine-containing phosphotransfer) domain-containing protein
VRTDALVDAEVLARLATSIGARALAEVLDLFLSNGPQRIEEARDGAEQGDLESATVALHSLKSSAGMLGAARLERIARSLEQVARARRQDELAARMPELERAWAELLPLLEKHRALG